MPSDNWAEIIQDYLTTDRTMLVSRQLVIRDEGDGSEIRPDFLAIDFRGRQVWLVEVNAGSDTEKMIGNAKAFQSEVVPRLGKQLTRLGIAQDASRWKFGFWAFVRMQLAARVLASLAPHVNFLRVEPLEDVVFFWGHRNKTPAEEVRASIDAAF